MLMYIIMCLCLNTEIFSYKLVFNHELNEHEAVMDKETLNKDVSTFERLVLTRDFYFGIIKCRLLNLYLVL